jgi:ribosome-binding factor A
VANRLGKVDEMLKREIAKILQENFPMEEYGLVTVTLVKTAEDLKDATIWVSVLGENAERAISFLNEKSWEIKSYLRERKLTIKYIPNLHFKLDLTAEKAARIEELLREIKKERK